MAKVSTAAPQKAFTKPSRKAPFNVGDLVRFSDPECPGEKKITREVTAVREDDYTESGWYVDSSERPCGCCGHFRSQVHGSWDSRYFRLVRRAMC